MTTALDLLPAPTWGALFVAAGVLVFYGRDTVQEAGLWLAAVWYGFFAATLCYSIVTIPTAGLLGLVWCVTCLAAHMITATWRAR